jgi:hypothetical protein
MPDPEQLRESVRWDVSGWVRELLSTYETPAVGFGVALQVPT